MEGAERRFTQWGEITRGNRSFDCPLPNGHQSDYLVFFSIVSLFFSSIFSPFFLVGFLVLPFALAWPLASSFFSPDFWATLSADFSAFFSCAGADGTAGVAGVAGFACAKLTPMKANVVKAATNNLIAFFTVSPPFNGY